MSVYRISENSQFNSREVYFESRPTVDVIKALKALKMRWNPKKVCWYGFATESELIAAIIGTQNDEHPQDIAPTVVTDGYMGGGAIYGSKSDRHLYGADLSKAIRDDIKAAGLKGCTVSCKTYSGGQSITVTVKANQEDMIPEEEFVQNYKIKPGFYWIRSSDNTHDIHESEYWTLTGEEQEEIRKAAAEHHYNRTATQGIEIVSHRIDEYNEYTQDMIEKLHKINSIVAAYRYDESNGQVDYFNTNFYYDIKVKPAA